MEDDEEEGSLGVAAFTSEGDAPLGINGISRRKALLAWARRSKALVRTHEILQLLAV
jgi:hypothetical protein